MSYIGREPQIGNFQMCDAISVVNNQAAYTMQVGGVAVIAGGNFNVIASVNGSVQKAGTSFTISSSTITFSQNLVTGDVIDFILILGSVLDLGVPSDGTVTTGKIVDSNVTNAKLENSSITLNGSAVSLGGSATIGGGKIGQVVSAVYDTVGTSTSSSSFVAMGLSVAITPSATSSKILVQVSGGSVYTANDKNGWITIYRDSTNLGNTNGFQGHFANTSYLLGALSMSTLDSPASTSAITYAVYIKTTSAPVGFQDSATRTVITAMEVLV